MIFRIPTAISRLSKLSSTLFLSVTFVAIAGCTAKEPQSSGLQGTGTQQQSVSAKPNIIFIFSDDVGWGDLGVRGHADIKTPNIDRLATEGTEFLQFTVSNPVCSPSRAAVMTGQYSARSSVHRHFATLAHNNKYSMPDWLSPEGVMMPRVLQSAGYKTAHFGKWHLTSRKVKDAPLPVQYGYDDAAVFNGPGPQANYIDLYDKAIDFIHENKDEPFFINLWIHETHTPHYPSEEGLRRYSHLGLQDRVYAAVVHDADTRIGKVLDTLDKAGLADNTLVVFSSDNGPEVTAGKAEFHHHGRKKNDGDFERLGRYFSVGVTGGLRGQKRDTYEGGIRVPFMARWPGVIPAGRTEKAAVINAVDLLPTFASIAGADLPKGYVSDGQDISELFKGDTSFKRKKPQFWHWNYGLDIKTGEQLPPLLAIRDGDWKLLRNANGKTELYNLAVDREEKNNVSEKHPNIVASLTEQVMTWETTLPDTPPASAFSKDRVKNNHGN